MLCMAGHRFVTLLFCFTVNVIKIMTTVLCVVVNVQLVTNHYSVLPRMIKPSVLMVCVFVWNQVLHRIKGSLLWLEASWSLWKDRAWCFVSSSLSCNIKCKYYRWENKIPRIFCSFLINLFVCLSVGLCLSFRTGYEQDIELGNTAQLGDCHGKTLISIPCHLSSDTYIHTYTQRYINTDTHMYTCMQMKHKPISTYTISLHTHTSNHSSNLPLHKSMCSINTHIYIQYMATCN